jgi:hypothetical protein
VAALALALSAGTALADAGEGSGEHPPIVGLAFTAALSATSAELRTRVRPQRSRDVREVRVRPTAAFGALSPPVSLGKSKSWSLVSTCVEGLQPGTSHHFRAVATNQDGTRSGSDAFDALLSARPYKDPWPIDEVLAELARQRGRQFDPVLVDAFLPIAPALHAEWFPSATAGAMRELSRA